MGKLLINKIKKLFSNSNTFMNTEPDNKINFLDILITTFNNKSKFSFELNLLIEDSHWLYLQYCNPKCIILL